MTKVQKDDQPQGNISSGHAPISNLGGNPFWDFWGPLLISLFLYTGIRHYLAEARYIPSGSMLPTLKINDRLLIEKFSYRIRNPKRGEIVVFNSPYSFDPILRSEDDPSEFQCLLVNLPIISYIPGLSHRACDAYIKRIVGLPGDEIFVNKKGELLLNKEIIDEPYIKRYCLSTRSFFNECGAPSRIVPEGHVFVLGDNRGNSWDGRYWPGISFLPRNEIIGRAIWRFWPINRVGSLEH